MDTNSAASVGGPHASGDQDNVSHTLISASSDPEQGLANSQPDSWPRETELVSVCFCKSLNLQKLLSNQERRQASACTELEKRRTYQFSRGRDTSRIATSAPSGATGQPRSQNGSELSQRT